MLHIYWGWVKAPLYWKVETEMYLN